jgi:hypothetical protein
MRVEGNEQQPGLLARERRLDQRVAVVGHHCDRVAAGGAGCSEEMHELVGVAGELAVRACAVGTLEDRRMVRVVLCDPPETKSLVPWVIAGHVAHHEKY